MNKQSPNQVNNKTGQPKKSHWKAKLVTALIAMVILIGIGIYIGSHFQRYYYSFIFNASHTIMTIAFWAIIILIAVLAIYIVYLVFKMKKKH